MAAPYGPEGTVEAMSCCCTPQTNLAFDTQNPMKRPPAPADAAAPERVKDPVCGMSVVPGASKGGSYEFEGETFHFCNPKCRERFAADPRRYLTDRTKNETATHDHHSHGHHHVAAA